MTARVTRMSGLFLHTLRDAPADAEVPSHALLVRAGYVRRVAAGIWTWLPLGVAALDRVAGVVRDEMTAMGAQEVHFPALLPREYYEVTGRWTEYGPNIFRLRDRREAEYLLGPTHEEMFTTLVKGEVASYRDLPLTLFQIQTKYRDEARPRAGILRGREFVMKDSYSFDLDDAGLAASYAAHRVAYARTFERLGLDYRIVAAVSGAMGGSASEEFLAVAPTGEDTFVACRSCDYAANTEAVLTAAPAAADGAGPAAVPPAPVPVATPDTPTIASLVACLSARDDLAALGLDGGVSAAQTLKNVVVKLRLPGRAADEVVVVGVPGDREVDLKRLEANLAPAEVVPFEAADFAAHPGLVRGYIGPQALPALGLRYLADPLVAPGTAWVTGGNAPDTHVVGLVAGRDFTVDAVVPAAEVRDGDTCPRCGGALHIGRGVEIGHIFQLGRKYTDAFGLDVLGPDGKPVRVTMGSYGIGVSRLVAAIAEQRHDAAGLSWPVAVAPYPVHIVAVGKGEEQQTAAADIAAQVAAAGVPVLLDDRRLAAGVAFADADLLGMPYVVVVGKGLVDGWVEVKIRRTGERSQVARSAVVADLLAAVAAG